MRSVLLCVLLVGCSTPAEVGVISEELSAGSVRALASFPDGFEMVGVSGDERVLFAGINASVTHPADVVTASRLTGRPLGSIPAPPGGWGVPAAILVQGDEVVVVDNGALPPFSHVSLHRYEFHVTFEHLCARYIDSVALPQQTFPPVTIDGVGYAGAIAALPGGQFALADALDGAIWVCSWSTGCALADADPDFAPAPAPPSFEGVGRAPGGGTRPYTLVIPNGLMPGLLNLEYAESTDEVCGARAAPPGGIWCIARSVLLDQSVPPFGKTKRTVVAPQIGVSDAGHGLAFDHWHPRNPWLYFVRSLADAVGGGSNVVRRVNLRTGEVQEVARSLEVMDFSTGLWALPPLVPGSTLTSLAVAMGQQENNGLENPVLGGVDAFVAPSIIAGVRAPAF